MKREYIQADDSAVAGPSVEESSLSEVNSIYKWLSKLILRVSFCSVLPGLVEKAKLLDCVL